MIAPIYFSSRVIDTLNSLPEEDRAAVSNAVTGQLIFGFDSAEYLTPIQNLVYSLIVTNVRRDTKRYSV